jgi:hypothetical protein
MVLEKKTDLVSNFLVSAIEIDKVRPNSNQYKTLRDILVISNEISLDIIIEWSLKIALQMIELHRNDCTHRNLSSRNILISNDFNELSIVNINNKNTIG